MKKITLSSERSFDSSDLIEVLHNVAKYNGSPYTVSLTHNGKYIECIPNKGYSNPKYTKGYYAILYLIDCLDNIDIAFTTPSGGCWFRIHVSDAPRLINYLLQ